jgi:hypothetical protein
MYALHCRVTAIYLSIYLSICLSIYGSTDLLLDHGLLFSFLILYTVDRTPWTWDQPVARPLPTHKTTQTQNRRTQTSMPWVGIEPTIPVFEQTKTVHTLDHPVTVIGRVSVSWLIDFLVTWWQCWSCVIWELWSGTGVDCVCKGVENDCRGPSAILTFACRNR